MIKTAVLFSLLTVFSLIVISCRTATGSRNENKLEEDLMVLFSTVPADNTGQARRVRLGEDMISLDGTPETFYVPYLFEAMDMFKNNFYIAYHTQKPSQAMGIPNGFNYRTASIDKVTVNPDGTIPPITMTRKGVEQVGNLNPYVLNEAETIGIQGGIYTRPESEASNGMVVTSIDTGDWIGVYGVDFGAVGANKFTVRVRTPETADYIGAIELRLDPVGDGVTGDNGNLSGRATTRIKGGEVIGRVLIKAEAGKAGRYADIEIDLDKTVTGVHDLVFVFYSSLGVNPETVNPDTRHKNGFEFDWWQFKKNV